MTSPAQEIMAQNTEEQLKELLKKLIGDGTLSDFLKKEMKAIMEQMICEKGGQGEVSVNVRVDKGKNKVPILGLFIEDDEYYQAMRGTFPQPTTPPVNVTKSEPSEEVKILANRMAQLEFSLKEKNVVRSHDYIDLSLFKDEPLTEDFKLLNFTKFNGTGDPRVHLR